jgi:hypothetical protein
MDNRNRTIVLKCLAAPTDAERIRVAAGASYMTVSTYLLVAALEKAERDIKLQVTR